MKHLLSALDARDHLEKILEDAEKFKSGEGPATPLKGKSLAMVFENPQLGLGYPLKLECTS